jgi:hypothetical protein
VAEAYATAAQYSTETRETLNAAKTAQVTAKLETASALIRSTLPDGYEPDPIVARTVCIQAVQRAIINPGGRRYRQIGSTSEGYETQTGLYLTEQEQEQLLAGYDSAGGDGATAFTVGLRDEAYPPRPYRTGGW